MKLLLLACFIAAASALPRKPLGSEKCTWGPAYWCKNYKQATECNAIEHCRRHVWKSNDLCSECKSVITEIHDYAQNNGTEILALLNLLCDQLGSMADECKAVVSLYGKTLLETLAELTADSEKLCQELGLCSKTKKEIHHTIMKVFIKQLKSNPTITNLKSVKADYCEDCKLVFGEIKDVLENKDLQKDIIGILEKFCGELGSFASECKSFVDMYGPLVLEEVSSLIDPASICAEIGLCNSTKKSISMILDHGVRVFSDPKIFFPMAPGPVLIGAEKAAKAKPVDTPKVSVECAVCEFMMRELDDILGENATKEEIEKALDEVCSILPSTIRSECQKLVNEYAPEIVDLLLQELQPSEICTELGLCTSGKKLLRVSLHKKVDGEECEFCKLVIGYAEDALKSNATEKEVQEALDAACKRLPSQLATECTELVNKYCADVVWLITEVPPYAVCKCLAVVNEYLDTLIKLILQKLSPEEICKEIGLCTAAGVKGYVKNKCFLGESYWCANYKNALKCEALQHCNFIV